VRGQSKSVAYVLLRHIILIFHSLSRREDYGRLYEFVCDKHLRIKDKGGKVVHTVSYNDEGSSDSEHDAYRERMIAEGEERDSEDGEAIDNPRPTS